MKKLFIIIVIILLSSMGSFALSDIDGHWAKPYIDYLIDKQAIAGYPDNTFKPEDTISVGEFCKILIAGLGHDEGNSSGVHWAENYMQKARDLKLIKMLEYKEFNNYNKPIDRGMMARLISRATTASFDDEKDYIAQIKDYQTINPVNWLAVLHVYRAGIVTGYPDGQFKDGNTASRAEAATILVRFFDASKRIEPKLIGGEIDYTSDINLPSGVNLHEKAPGETCYDFYVSLNILEPLEPQYRDAEQFLKRWLDDKTINEIMMLVKTKKVREDGFERVFTYDNKKIAAGSHKYGYIIDIKGFLKD